MRNKIAFFLSDGLFRAAGILFATSMVSNVFNYGFQVAMGRILLPSEYGLLNALLALLVVLSVPVSTLMMLVARKTSAYKASGDASSLRFFFNRTNARVLVAGVIGLGILLSLSGKVASYVKAPSTLPVALLGACALTAIVTPINMAVLQGVQDYFWMGVNAAFAGPARFAFCLAPAFCGFGVTGVMSGIVVTNAILWACSYFPLRRHFDYGAHAGHIASIPAAETLSVLLANLSFAVLTQMDIVLVARHFTPELAGLYASASVFGKAVMYVPGAIVLALFPMVTEQSSRHRDSRALLLKAIGGTVLLSGSGAATFYCAPSWALNLFFGPRYVPAAPYLQILGPAMLTMAILTVVMNYLIAQGYALFPYIMAIGAIGELAAIHRWHASIGCIVGTIAASGGILAAIGLLIAFSAKAEENAHDTRITDEDLRVSGIGSRTPDAARI